MSMKIGEVDVSSQILDSEFRIGVLERIIEVLVRKFPVVGGPISEAEMQQIRLEVVSDMRRKYPNTLIELKPQKPRRS